MTPENIRKMAAHLRTVPPELFNMGAVAEETSCGTVCCLAGHVPAVFPDYELCVCEINEDLLDLHHKIDPDLNDYTKCISTIFGIPRRHALELTWPGRPSDPLHIADTLDDFAEHASIERVEDMDQKWREAHE